VLLNSITTIYVFNDCSRFKDWDEVQVDDNDYVLTGTAEVPIQGYSMVVLCIMGPNGLGRWLLQDVAFYDSYVTNVVFFQTLYCQGHW
jgi:hypothetical protein